MLSTLWGARSAFYALLIATVGYAHADRSTFKDQILSQRAIPQPAAPFVTVFFHGGDDRSDYGLALDGTMSEDDWREVLLHVGYLSPYAPIKPDAPDRWKTHRYDIAIKAAQAIGRYSGGSIMGAPANVADERNVAAAYADPLCLRMTHFFHDDERDLGTPGGGGGARLRMRGGGATLETAAGDSVALPAEYRLSFGVYVGEYVFGGAVTLLSLLRANDGAPIARVGFVNEGGFSGANYFEASVGNGAVLRSPALTAFEAARWQVVDVTIQRALGGKGATATLSVRDFGASAVDVAPSSVQAARLVVGDLGGYKADIDVDNLILGDASGAALASYDFEDGTRAPDETVAVARDGSGHGHDLRSRPGDARAFTRRATSGIDPATAASVKKFLIDDLLAARRRADVPAPSLLTNWRLSDRPERVRFWAPLGFTNGSTEYYLLDPPDPSATNLARVFANRTEITQWAWADGSQWTHAWVGNATADVNVLSTRDYLSLVALGVLDGNRWFSVFTAMSHGSLAGPNATRRDAAIYTADGLYSMATAASWFQSTSKGLESSEFLADVAREFRAQGILFRGRVNPRTQEMWFAAVVADPRRSERGITVRLPSRGGTLVDLATGSERMVPGSDVDVLLRDVAYPQYFRPSARRE